MNYKKLRVTHLTFEDGDWHIRFTGDSETFHAAVDDLKSYNSPGYTRARWNPGLFGGKGGWIVDGDVLRSCAGYFDCLVSRMDTIEYEIEREKERQREEKSERLKGVIDRMRLEREYRRRSGYLKVYDDEKVLSDCESLIATMSDSELKAMTLLALVPFATQQDVRSAYRGLSKTCHPDTGGTHEQFIELGNAQELALEWIVIRDVRRSTRRAS